MNDDDINMEHIIMGTPTPYMREARDLPASNLPNPPPGHNAVIIPLSDVFAGRLAAVGLNATAPEATVEQDLEADWNAGGYKQHHYTALYIQALEETGVPPEVLQDFIKNLNPYSQTYYSRTSDQIFAAHGMSSLGINVVRLDAPGHDGPKTA